MKKIIYLLSIVAALAMPVSALAQHHPHHPHGNNHPAPVHHHQPAMQPELPPCATPEQMGMVMHTLRAQLSDDKKLEIANLCVTIGYFCTDDLARMAKVFAFDDKRLEFLRYAYAFCTDKERYPTLRGCFTFSSNYEELMKDIYR